MNTTTIPNAPYRKIAKCSCGAHTSFRIVATVYRANGPWIAQVSDVASHLRVGDKSAFFCRVCGAEITPKHVHGKLSTHIKCDSRCTQAKGTVCECSCAGENHGAGLSAIPFMVAS